MLNDPLYLAAVSPNHGTLRGTMGSTSPVLPRLQLPFRVTDLAPGKSVRVGVDSANIPGVTRDFTISHSSSKENAPYTTLRTVCRLDVNHVDANGVSVTTSAYVVVVAPQGVAGHEQTALQTAQDLCSTVLFGPRKDPAIGSDAANSITDFLERVLAGEP
jgi:hypothetical protein